MGSRSDFEVQHVTVTVMHQIQDVIKNMVVPSWVGSVPTRFGESVTGTLKADEWRTLATLHLPIALIICWSDVTACSDATVAQRLRCILDHTMLLVSAIWLACRRMTTWNIARQYKQYMSQYMCEFGTMHPDAMSIHITDFIEQFGPVDSW